MSVIKQDLKEWLSALKRMLEKDLDTEPDSQISFIEDPALAIELIHIIVSLEEDTEEDIYYSACIFALDICVMQLKSAIDSDNKKALKTLKQLMQEIAQLINNAKKSLSFWLPVMNAFYEAQVDLDNDLQQAYLNLAYSDDENVDISPQEHLEVIRNVIHELSDLSLFELAENFFAQSYAMPPEFFADLIYDFYSIEEAHDLALLTLLHPKAEVRDVALIIFDQLIQNIELSPISLWRLQNIKSWFSPVQQEMLSRWLKIQRKKGVVFQKPCPGTIVSIHATEVDGSGSQGLFIHVKQGRVHHVCGFLLKQTVGIKEAWVTPGMTSKNIQRYYKEAFGENITLRKVDESYVLLMVNHFLTLTIAEGRLPNLHVLEIQELLGCHFIAETLDVEECMQQLSIQISPFTEEVVEQSLKRSKDWFKQKAFTESWFIENGDIDKVVNQCSRFIEGAKVCDVEKAKEMIFSEIFEKHRDQWLFHFLRMAFWAKSKARAQEKLWKDNFLIAYLIYTGRPLHTIPLMNEIVQHTVWNSIETMQERRTYLA